MADGDIILTKRANRANVNSSGFLSYRDVCESIEYCYLKEDAPIFSRNISFKRNISKSVVILVNAEDMLYREKVAKIPYVTENFPDFYRLLPEAQILKETLNTAVTISDPQALIAEHTNLDIARWHINDAPESLKAIYDVRENDRIFWRFWWRTGTHKSTLLLPLWQQLARGVPMPCTHGDFKVLKEHYKTLYPDSPIRSIDFETMQMLSRGVVMDERYRVLLDKCLSHPYRVERGLEPGFFQVRYSEDFQNGTLPETVELAEFLTMLENVFDEETVWLGHNVVGDLLATKVIEGKVIDTELLFNLSGRLRSTPSLSTCANHFLNREVADHNPKNDTRSAMKLCHLILSKGIGFGNEYLQTRRKDIVSKGSSVVYVDDKYLDKYKLLLLKVSAFAENVTLKPFSSDELKVQGLEQDIQENSHLFYALELNETDPEILAHFCNRIINVCNPQEITVLYVVVNYEKFNSGTLLVKVIPPPA